MSTPTDWIWGTLPPELMRHAEAVARRQLKNVQKMGLKQTRFSFTKTEWYQKLLGAQGEVAFRSITGRPIPSVEEMVSTWHGPDADGYQVKTTSSRHGDLLFSDIDVTPATKAFVVVLNEAPRLAIMGKRRLEQALEERTWGWWLPYPAWCVRQRLLDPWSEDER